MYAFSQNGNANGVVKPGTQYFYSLSQNLECFGLAAPDIRGTKSVRSLSLAFPWVRYKRWLCLTQHYLEFCM